MMNQELDIRYIERFMAETVRANDFNEENINSLMERIGAIERTVAAIIKALEEQPALPRPRLT